MNSFVLVCTLVVCSYAAYLQFVNATAAGPILARWTLRAAGVFFAVFSLSLAVALFKGVHP